MLKPRIRLTANAYNPAFPEWLQTIMTNTKHNNNYDFGWPESITFDMYYRMYERNGLASAGINHAIQKTWREYPWLCEGTDEPHKETMAERGMREFIARLNLWQKCAQADKRSRVGEYGALILRFADGLQPREPVDPALVRGLDKLVEIIPAWQGQLIPSGWNTDPLSLDYGKPNMYLFQESAVDPDQTKIRSFEVHPDRVIIWSEDGTIHGTPVLKAGYNDLLTIEKITGSGGEGFWKNAKSAPVLNIAPDANLASLASMLGVQTDGLADKMDEVVAGWQRGFDQLLMLQGIDAKTLGITLPQPAEFLAGPLQSFAASINEPMKILLGTQTGERASSEDAKEWDSTIMARRENYVKPMIRRLLDRLALFGTIPALEWVICWTDLTEDSSTEKLDKALKMAQINKELIGTGERAFAADEIREAAGFDPLEEELGDPDDSEDSDQDDDV